MLGTALSPYLVAIIMCIQVIYALIVGEVIVWWEWLIFIVWVSGALTHLIYLVFIQQELSKSQDNKTKNWKATLTYV